MRVGHSGMVFDRKNFNIILIYNCGTDYLIYKFILNLRLCCSSLKHIHQYTIKLIP